MTQTKPTHRINNRVKNYHPNDFVLDPIRNLVGIENTESFKEMVASLVGRQAEKLSPIQVACTFWVNDKGEKVLLEGHRRVLAAKAVECEVPAYEVREPTLFERYANKLISNQQHEPLDPVSEAQAYAEMINEIEGTNAHRIAQALGVSDSLISQKLALLKLTTPLRTAVQTGQLSAKAGYNASRIPEDDQIAHAEEIVACGTASRVKRKATAIRRMNEMEQPVQQVDDVEAPDINPEPLPSEDLTNCLMLLAQATDLVKQAVSLANEFNLPVDNEVAELIEEAQKYYPDDEEATDD